MLQAAAGAVPEITTLLEAARYGDLEAVEDFIAIGKEVTTADKEGRTPLHYAAAIDHVEVRARSQPLLQNHCCDPNARFFYAIHDGGMSWRLPLTLLLLRLTNIAHAGCNRFATF